MKPKTLHAMGFSGIRMLCVPRTWVTSVLVDSGADVVRTTDYRGTSHQQVWYAAKKSQD
jgi:hypothetical protein